MFEILAGILIIAIGYESYKNGEVWTLVDLAVPIGVALIGVGLDTMIFRKK